MNASGTDWHEILRRLAVIEAAIEEEFLPSPEEERRILRERAQLLAVEPRRGAAADEILETVEFELGGERYAFPLEQVREVSMLRGLTPVPCTPSFVLGIINLRGEIRTVIDLKKFFELPDAGLTELNKIIVIAHGGARLGVLADAIRGVRRVPLAELQPSLPTLTDVRAAYLRGVTPDRLVVLDAGKILSDSRTVVDEEVSP
jgi:purine-binding chemotaxis protein CheW